MQKPSTFSMKDRVCVVTGATSGVGKVSALELARLGASVTIVVRDATRGQAVADEIRAATGREVLVVTCDFASLASIRAAAAQLLERLPKIHVLLNNAGAMNLERKLSTDGLELTFATNHLGYFLLTMLLLDRLKASAPARIVNVASNSHRGAKGISFDDLAAEKGYSGFGRYGESKLANILFTYELARRLDGTGVTANCLHPGVVSTGFGANSGSLFRLALRIGHLFMLSPEQGARTQIYLASSPEVEGVSGKYFAKCRDARSNRVSHDEELQKRLWRESEKLCGIAGTT